MLTNEREKAICKKYSTRGTKELVLCNICPLRKGSGHDFKCKANSHYNRKTKEWEYDYESEGVNE